MIFGKKDIYAIEVYHKPCYSDGFYMMGRMCIHLFNKAFGDINEECCHIGGFYETLLEKINKINFLEHDFGLNNDYEVFNLLDEKLYIGDISNRTYEQIILDNEPYDNFIFMTNAGGESFDKTKSFIYLDTNNMVHILFQKYDENDEIFPGVFDREIFINVSKDFINWYDKTFENRENDKNLCGDCKHFLTNNQK